jgi:hypothetical protein
MRRILVLGQSGQEVHKTPYQPITECGGTCLPSQAIQEAEIRRITALGQPRQKKFVRPHLNGKKLGMVAHACLQNNQSKNG